MLKPFNVTKGDVLETLLQCEKKLEKMSLSSDLLLGEGEGITRNRRHTDVCAIQKDWEKIRNKKEKNGCRGASGVALYVNQKHKVLPPQVYYHRCR